MFLQTVAHTVARCRCPDHVVIKPFTPIHPENKLSPVTELLLEALRDSLHPLLQPVCATVCSAEASLQRSDKTQPGIKVFSPAWRGVAGLRGYGEDGHAHQKNDRNEGMNRMK